MVKLGRSLLETFPDAQKYTSTKIFTFNTIGPQGRPVTISQRNFNTLLFYDSRVNGIKTGHVDEAGYHLVASARADEHQVDLGRDRHDEHGEPGGSKPTSCSNGPSDLHHRQSRLAQGGARAGAGLRGRRRLRSPIAPRAGQPYFTVVRGQEGRIKLTANLSHQPLVAPLPKGTTVGELTVMLGDKPLSSVPIVTQAEVKAGGYIHRVLGFNPHEAVAANPQSKTPQYKKPRPNLA